MGFFEIFAIGIGLSMDAFAASVCEGLSMRKLNIKNTMIIAFMFGLFQFLMPLLGYFFCVQFESYIEGFDHWIAFAFLCFIGAKLIFDAIKEKRESSSLKLKADSNIDKKDDPVFSFRRILLLSIATSIDALAVGISFAFFDINIFSASAIVGITTFVLSILGVLLGNFFGEKYKTPAQIVGGIILIGIGFKILFEHLGVI